jgi:hypothetical protein
MMPAYSGATAAALLVAFFVAWFVLLHRLHGGLRDRHLHTWNDMGRPTILGGRPRDTAVLLRFLVRGEFRALGDSQLTRIATSMRIILIVYSALFLTLLVQVFKG